MQYRKDLKSNNDLSIIGFGCMRFPKTLGIIDIKNTEKLILSAIERGINYFDTAYIYPGSEETLGTIVQKNNVRDKIYIATKLPIFMCSAASDFDKLFNESLKRLKTDYIDYYLIHNIGDIKAWDRLKKLGIEEWLAQKKREGKIKHAGFSFHGMRDEFLKLLDVYDWDFCQIQYNYSDENYQAGRTGLQAAAKKGISVIIMEPLLGGKLITGLPKKAQAEFKKAKPTSTPASWALNWLWDQSEVSLVLSGMSSMEQLNENIALAGNAKSNCFTEEDFSVIKKVLDAFSETYKVHCTGCNYCMPCPHGVNIPGCFAAYNQSFAHSITEGLKQYVLSTGALTANPHRAIQCVKCGACQAHCPQNIAIINELKNASKRLETLSMRAIIAIARAFSRKG
ncbi:MAG: aldo/keto reductase [Termitinemataceae bacterium]|nr:MAG: aldo/keto reductase [Termitinemataceae bacterium]